MKKILALTLALFASLSAFAQLEPPTQTDTLWITGVTYNYDRILPQNWPCTTILKSTTGFVFGDRRFSIVEVSMPYYIVYTVQGPDGQYELKMDKDEDGETCTIWFSGYKFDCTYENPEDEEVEIEDQDDWESAEPIPVGLVEVAPKFMGKAADTFADWVNERLKYPQIAYENGVQGRVIVAFTIAFDGSVEDVKVLRGIDPFLDAEAVRVISSSPKWTPGIQRGHTVRVRYTFPVIFQLT